MNGHDRRERLAHIREIADSLREPLETPDFTREILARVHSERPFLGEGTRRLVIAGRLALAGGVGLVALAVAVAHRAAPESTNWAGRAVPLSDMLDTAEATTTARLTPIVTALDGVNAPAPATSFLSVLAGRFAEGLTPMLASAPAVPPTFGPPAPAPHVPDGFVPEFRVASVSHVGDPQTGPVMSGDTLRALADRARRATSDAFGAMWFGAEAPPISQPSPGLAPLMLGRPIDETTTPK